MFLTLSKETSANLPEVPLVQDIKFNPKTHLFNLNYIRLVYPRLWLMNQVWVLLWTSGHRLPKTASDRASVRINLEIPILFPNSWVVILSFRSSRQLIHPKIFDIIISTSWLSLHRADIRCFDKAVHLNLPIKEPLVIYGDKSSTNLRIISCI